MVANDDEDAAFFYRPYIEVSPFVPLAVAAVIVFSGSARGMLTIACKELRQVICKGDT